MRPINPVVCVVLALCFAGSVKAIGIGEAAPDFAFDQTWHAPEGKNRLSDYRGSVVLLECWATWCGPCKQIIPHMRELDSVFTPQGLNIISVSDEDASKIEPFIESNGMSYPVARAKGVLGMYGRHTIPSAWIINAAGAVIWEGHPAEINSVVMQNALNAPPTQPTKSAGIGGGNWWLWMIVIAGALFAAAVGWFLYSTRDKMPKTLQTGWQPPPPPQQAHGPPGPPPGQYGAPPPGQYGAPPPQAPPPAYGSPPQPPGQGYLNAGPAPQTLGYNAPPPPPQQQQPGVGGNNAYGGAPTYTGNTEFLQPKKDAPFLGGAPDEGEFPPFDTNQNRPGNR